MFLPTPHLHLICHGVSSASEMYESKIITSHIDFQSENGCNKDALPDGLGVCVVHVLLLGPGPAIVCKRTKLSLQRWIHWL
jgi:hypothetical protein